jgi:hypothetical protein
MAPVKPIQIKDIDETSKRVRAELRTCIDAHIRGDNVSAYAAAERAQHICFELKELFMQPLSIRGRKPSPSDDEMAQSQLQQPER